MEDAAPMPLPMLPCSMLAAAGVDTLASALRQLELDHCILCRQRDMIAQQLHLRHTHRPVTVYQRRLFEAS